MRKYFKGLLALALAAGIMALGGCAGEKEPALSATPGSYRRDGSSNPTNLKNAIKAGEVYRYYVWNTEDESDPFKNVDGVRKEMAVNNKAQFEEKYGVTIRYVLSAGGDDWYADAFCFGFRRHAHDGYI